MSLIQEATAFCCRLGLCIVKLRCTSPYNGRESDVLLSLLPSSCDCCVYPTLIFCFDAWGN